MSRAFCLIAILAAPVCAQEARDWRTFFPLEDGREWKYLTDSGTTFTTVATADPGAPGRWILTTTGFRPDESWPVVLRETIELDEGGVRIVGLSLGPSGGGEGGEGYLLRGEFDVERPWWGTRAASIRTIDGGDSGLMGGMEFRFGGFETRRWAGEDRLSAVVQWSSAEQPEHGALGVTCTQWYAEGIGCIRGEIALTRLESARSMSWELVAPE